GTRIFMYFTIQSNIAIALICAVGLFVLERGKDISGTWYIVKFVGTVAITLTGVVFVIVLAPTLGDRAWNAHNVLTHVVVPIAAVIDFFIVMAGVTIRKINVFFCILPPLLYAIYAGIGYVRGWEFSGGHNYPYFFLNWGSPAGAFGFTDELPYMGSAWWILALFVFLVIIGFIYLVIAERIGKRSKQKSREGIRTETP
nr:Pr6Pr family membrane protein [Lachnospiraceae bacterium]